MVALSIFIVVGFVIFQIVEIFEKTGGERMIHALSLVAMLLSAIGAVVTKYVS